jgi:hypothetical protein
MELKKIIGWGVVVRIDLAQRTDQWTAVVNTAANLGVL